MKHTWCLQLKESLPAWLQCLYPPERPGQVPFCLRGNALPPSPTTGLPASVFALKLAYQIGLVNQLDDPIREGWIRHIQGFQKEDTGYFEDSAFTRLADRRAGRWWRKRSDWNVRRAETRQAVAALIGAGGQPRYPLRALPQTPQELVELFDSFPWHHPWHSGSQASGVVAMVHHDRVHHPQAQAVIETAFGYFENLRDPKTGAWYRARRQPPRRELVNGAMKVLTAYWLLDKAFDYPERLIDLCLEERHDRDACHSLDVVFVLHQAAKWTTHRRDDIQRYAEALLARIRPHCKPDGGLSFYRDRAQTRYSQVVVSEGLAESDVQGTHLLVWAITLCASLLGFQDELKWRFPVT